MDFNYPNYDDEEKVSYQFCFAKFDIYDRESVFNSFEEEYADIVDNLQINVLAKVCPESSLCVKFVWIIGFQKTEKYQSFKSITWIRQNLEQTLTRTLRRK